MLLPPTFKLSFHKISISNNAAFYNTWFFLLFNLLLIQLQKQKQNKNSDGRNPTAGLRGLKTEMKLSWTLPG